MLLVSRIHRTALALLLVLAGVACGTGNEVTADALSTPPPPPVNVAVARVASAQLTERVELSGRLERWVEVQVSSELGGMVEQIGFEKGGFVTEGQVLAQVGTDLYAAALAEAEALLSGAESTYERAPVSGVAISRDVEPGEVLPREP